MAKHKVGEGIELGDKVRHVISGLEGFVTSKTEYISGCIRFSVLPEIKKGKVHEMPKESFIDLQELIVIKKKDKKISAKRTGGSRPNPQNRSNPVR